MAGPVTYADLKFLKKSLNRKKSPRSNGEGSITVPSEVDGDVIYENIEIPRMSEETVRLESTQRDTNQQKEVFVAVKAKRISHVTVLLLIPCLFLLSSTVTLGVKYLQVSHRLTNSTKRFWLLSQEHEALASNLSLTLSTKEEELKETELQLHQARSAQETLRQKLKSYESEEDKWRETAAELKVAIDKWNQAKLCVSSNCYRAYGQRSCQQCLS
ncbi:B-cell differentiation antigen CD72 [Microcaecilia unicolor]|uniref:B-cell differentiation antigen CD72-like n=1 Tax=Microcaecilia unicolor TaxID=1415580 RepID=A0A6P7XC16_9AMPH|nr:B-cell differentiation antigen CD72-like [Microcaecilia unicolor]